MMSRSETTTWHITTLRRGGSYAVALWIGAHYQTSAAASIGVPAKIYGDDNPECFVWVHENQLNHSYRPWVLRSPRNYIASCLEEMRRHGGHRNHWDPDMQKWMTIAKRAVAEPCEVVRYDWLLTSAAYRLAMHAYLKLPGGVQDVPERRIRHSSFEDDVNPLPRARRRELLRRHEKFPADRINEYMNDEISDMAVRLFGEGFG